MDKNSKIFIAGHRGMVGSAIERKFRSCGYTNILTRTHSELDLCDPGKVKEFFHFFSSGAAFLAFPFFMKEAEVFFRA